MRWLAWLSPTRCFRHLEWSCIVPAKARSIFPAFVFPIAVFLARCIKTSVQHWDSEPCLGKGPFPLEKTLPCLCASPEVLCSACDTHSGGLILTSPGTKCSSSCSRLLQCCLGRSTWDTRPHDPYGCPNQCHHQGSGTVFTRASPALCSGVLFSPSLCGFCLVPVPVLALISPADSSERCW